MDSTHEEVNRSDLKRYAEVATELGEHLQSLLDADPVSSGRIMIRSDLVRALRHLTLAAGVEKMHEEMKGAIAAFQAEQNAGTLNKLRMAVRSAQLCAFQDHVGYGEDRLAELVESETLLLGLLEKFSNDQQGDLKTRAHELIRNIQYSREIRELRMDGKGDEIKKIINARLATSVK